MPRTKLQEVAELGQSLWLDYISRQLLETGKLKEWINNGLRGMTSNPSIFCQAISTGKEYDEKIAALREAGKSIFEIYDELTIADIQNACDHFKGVYEETAGLDGYVSLEINPKLANDTATSISEGKRLFHKVNRPNLMIKVPATDEGFPVIEELLANAVNVNVTLIFSLAQYEKTVDAFLKGLQRLSQSNQDLSKVRSVASVFVSRVDSAVDKLLEEKITQSSDNAQKDQWQALKGKAAVANSQVIFAKFKELFKSSTFQALADKRCAEQRVLWGSTSTKDPKYSDVKYVDELIGSPTVNTVPEKTLVAFMDHGTALSQLTADAKEALALFAALKQIGIDIDEVNQKLLDGGVEAFIKSFDELMDSIEAKAKTLCAK